MAEKVVRDPVHDVIAFRTERPADRLLFGLINAAEVQRLRRIRQLGLTSLAYPGADHSRYSHSIGVMETARKMLAALAMEHPIDEYQRAVCSAAALLHDVGHGPFSHMFERVSGVRHEEFTCRVILDEGGEVYGLLERFNEGMARDVVDLLQHRPKRTAISDVISSQLDADRFDYLLRDNLMTGSQYGAYDLTWLLHALTIDRQGDRLAVHARGISAVEAFLQARYHMYRNVYFHKVTRSAEGLVRLVLRRAKDLVVAGKLKWPEDEHAVYAALLGQELTLAQFTELDDYSVVHCFKLWSRSGDAMLERLCKGLLYRRLYRAIELPSEMAAGDVEKVVSRARDAVLKTGGDGEYDVFYDEGASTPYDLGHGATGGGGERQIAVVDETGAVRPFSEISRWPDALTKQLAFKRLHVVAEYLEVVAALRQ